MRQIAQKQREEAEKAAADARLAAAQGLPMDGVDVDALPSTSEPAAKRPKSSGEVEWEDMPVAADAPKPTAKPARRNRWDATPVAGGDTAGGSGNWDATPKIDAGGGGVGGPTPKRTRSRWDETPLIRAGAAGDPNATPLVGAGGFDGGATPGPGQLAGMMTPDIHGLAAQHMAQANVPMTPEQYNAMRWEREVEARNAPLSDEDLDLMLPSEGYKILETPASTCPFERRRGSSRRRPRRTGAPPRGFTRCRTRTGARRSTSRTPPRICPT